MTKSEEGNDGPRTEEAHTRSATRPRPPDAEPAASTGWRSSVDADGPRRKLVLKRNHANRQGETA